MQTSLKLRFGLAVKCCCVNLYVLWFLALINKLIANSKQNPILDAINTSLYASLEHGQLMRVISGQSVLYLFSWLFVRSCRFRSSSTWRLETFETLPKPLFVSLALIDWHASLALGETKILSFVLSLIHSPSFCWVYMALC